MKDRNLKLKVGQQIVVVIEPCSNASRYVVTSLKNIDKWCFNGEVTIAGRKYITVKFQVNDWFKTEQFVIDEDYRQKYNSGGADYKLFLSKDNVLEKLESDSLYSYIKEMFNGFYNSGFTLDQLKRIESIVNEE